MRTIQRPSIHSQSPEALGNIILGAVILTTAWPAANDALFVPVVLQRPALVKRLFSINGTVASGNIEMGIYTLDGSRIVTSGSSAQAGTSAIQFLDIADTYLSPGQYYMACALNNTTGRVGRYNVTVIRQRQYGVLKAASALPLPVSATLATPTDTNVPSIGMELVGIL